MSKEKVRVRIEEIGIIPAIRLFSASDALFAAEAISDSGIPIVEVTMTVLGISRDLIQPDAIALREGDWIRELSRRFLRIVHDARAQMQAV